MTLRKTFLHGILGENPIFRLMLGICPTLAVSTTVFNGLGMGIAATLVLMFTNLAISLMRKAIPEAIRIPAFMVIIAAFVTVVQLIIEAFVPALHRSLGIFIPLIACNCIVFERAEAFAFQHPPLPSLVDGLGMGLGFTLSITALAALREVLGNGTFLGVQVMPGAYQPMAIITSPPGGFIMLGLMLAAINLIVRKRQRRAAGKATSAAKA
ncbi:MAG: electron transport complex subunit E [Clostridia bacterium]|nr:electron transport complex subunit E [Clostridia bacterium]